ncbi:uncharacterized protein [Dipodomys merriami]|uniref:uncharacterized protein n=1 Tax=Dipodomys merriami TaxID=94247 RepID=UPI003855C660
MFLCCFQSSRDSGLRHEKCECLTRSCRHWISAKPLIQCLRPCYKKKSRETQGNSGKCDNESSQTLNVPYSIWSLDSGLLEMLLMDLVPAYQKGDLFYVGNFLHHYRQWGTMEQLLDILFKKSFYRNWEKDEQVKNIVCSIFTMWVDFYPDDFYEHKNLDTLKELTQYVKLNMPSSDLLFRLHILLDQLEQHMTCETKKKRKKSLFRCLRACFHHRREIPAELHIKNPSVMSPMVTDGDWKPSLDSRKHVNIEDFFQLVERSKKVSSPVDIPLVLNPTCDAGVPVHTTKEEDDPKCLPLMFTIHLDHVHTSKQNTGLGVQDKCVLMENDPSLSSGKLKGEVQNLDSVKERESVLTEYPDQSVLLQRIQFPIEKLESVPPSSQEENSVFNEEVDTFEDSEAEFLPEGNLEANLDLEIPSPLPGKIFIFLFVLIVIKCSFYPMQL